MFYGYGRCLPNTEDLLELREVSIATTPDVLRQIAGFLEEMARRIETGDLHPHSHRHIGMIIPDWDERYPNNDLIVLAPGPDERHDGPVGLPHDEGL